MKHKHTVYWCMCTKLENVYRDGYSTCSRCGGRDAYGKSQDRPEHMKKGKVS